MNSGASDDFVSGLKSKIQDDKIYSEFKKNILQDALECVLDIFASNPEIQVRNTKNFDSKEFCFFVDVNSVAQLEDEISKCLDVSKITYRKLNLDDYKWVFQIDLGKRIVSSGSPHNVFFIEIYSKRLSLHKIKFSICDFGFKYSIFDSGYHNFRFWVFDKGFSLYDIPLKGIDRNKKKQKIETADGKFSLSFGLNTERNVTSLELARKKGKKIKD
jgi:hypothetical protein